MKHMGPDDIEQPQEESVEETDPLLRIKGLIPEIIPALSKFRSELQKYGNPVNPIIQGLPEFTERFMTVILPRLATFSSYVQKNWREAGFSEINVVEELIRQERTLEKQRAESAKPLNEEEMNRAMALGAESLDKLFETLLDEPSSPQIDLRAMMHKDPTTSLPSPNATVKVKIGSLPTVIDFTPEVQDVERPKIQQSPEPVPSVTTEQLADVKLKIEQHQEDLEKIGSDHRDEKVGPYIRNQIELNQIVEQLGEKVKAHDKLVVEVASLKALLDELNQRFTKYHLHEPQPQAPIQEFDQPPPRRTTPLLDKIRSGKYKNPKMTD